MPLLTSKPVTYTGPFEGLNFFNPRSTSRARRSAGNTQRHLLQANNVRCKEHVIRSGPGNIRLPSKPASDSPYHLIVQWLVIQGDKLVPRIFLANDEKIFRGDFLAFSPPVINVDGSVYSDTLDFLLDNPPGFDLADYPGLDVSLGDVFIAATGVNTYQFNLGALDANFIAIYPTESVGSTVRTIKFDTEPEPSFTIFANETTTNVDTSLNVDDGAGGSVFADIRDGALILNTVTSEIMLVTATPSTDTVSVQRGYAGTTAVAITDGQSLTVTNVGLPIFTALESNPGTLRNAQSGEYMRIDEAPFTIFANETTTNVDTSLTVDDGSGGSVFANVRAGFVITNNRTSEQMLVTAAPSDTLTVVRGYNSTTAEPIIDGDRLETDRVLVTRGLYGFPVAANVTENQEFVQVPFAYKWEVVSGPAGLTFDDDTSPSPVVTIPGSGGEWMLRVAVDDGYSVVCAEFVFIKDIVVTANAGVNQNFPFSDPLVDEVVMAAGATGLNPVYLWTQITGDPVIFSPSPSVLNPTVFLPPTSEQFILQLRVTGAGGLTATDTMSIFRDNTALFNYTDDGGNTYVDEFGNVYVG
jgi:hypothetical protein